MELIVLGSSSRGNCYILNTPTGSLLLECGVKFIDIQKVMNFDLSGVRGCLITHGHQDHCKSVGWVINSGIDVFCSDGAARDMGLYGHRTNLVRDKEEFDIGDFTIVAFATQHDASEPLGYLIRYNPTGEKLLFATDTFYIRYKFSGLHYILVECNYIKDILDANIEAGKIPEALKNRLLESHFSLEYVKEFLKANDLSHTRKIVLLHLSDGNSDIRRMKAEIEQMAGTNIEVEVAEPGKAISLELYQF